MQSGVKSIFLDSASEQAHNTWVRGFHFEKISKQCWAKLCLKYTLVENDADIFSRLLKDVPCETALAAEVSAAPYVIVPCAIVYTETLRKFVTLSSTCIGVCSHRPGQVSTKPHHPSQQTSPSMTTITTPPSTQPTAACRTASKLSCSNAGCMHSKRSALHLMLSVPSTVTSAHAI